MAFECIICLSKHKADSWEAKHQGMSSFQIDCLEENLICTKMENGQRLVPLNKLIKTLEAELRETRSKVERQAAMNHNLVCVKLKLETEINNYQRLIHDMAPEDEM